jgi:hypothetical protein
MVVKMMPVLAVALLLAVGAPQHPVAETVFRGRPSVKVQEGGLDRSVEEVSAEKAAGFECVISQIGDTYYWASRENRVMLLHEAPGYLTFVAEDGSGYVKIVKPEAKKAVATMGGAALPEVKFDYLEHIPIGLTTLTYYGTTRSKS